MKDRLKKSFQVSLIHFCLSLLISGLIGLLIWLLWFPAPYHKISGGINLFLLIVVVDVVCGPLLSLVIFSDKKSMTERVVDFSLIGLIQLSALTYGVYTLALARPIYLIHEIDRFKVVTFSDIKDVDILLKPINVPNYGYFGPRTIGVKVANPEDKDYLDQLELSLRGQDAAVRVERWTRYEDLRGLVIKNSKPIDLLFKLNPNKSDYIESELKILVHEHAELRWVPLESRFTSDWVVLVGANKANIVKIINVSGY